MKYIYKRTSLVLIMLVFYTFASAIVDPYILSLEDVTFDETTGTITDYTGTATDIEIPASFTVNNQIVAVQIIGNSAFNRNSLTSVTIASSVNLIAAFAFKNNYLSSINIPSSVTSIGRLAFSDNLLTSVTIPLSVSTIEEGAFNKNLITELNGEISKGIIYSRNSDGSNDISTIVSYGGTEKVIDFIPSSTTVIGSSAFSFNSLTSVTIPEGVTHIGENAFIHTFLTSATIPSSVDTIGEGAFSKNSLISITIPEGLTYLGELAFSNNLLTSVTIPSSVTTIREGAFNANLITELNGEISNGIIYGRNSDGSDNLSNIVSYGGTSKIIGFIPSSVTTIGDRAFSYNSLTSVTIPSSVISIGLYAFYGNSIEKIVLPTHPNLSSYGWVDDSGSCYAAGAAVTNLRTSYAIPGYTINYELNEGVNSTNNPIAYRMDVGVSSFVDATQTGYTFGGWFSDDTLSTQVTEITAGSTSDTTLYAKWIINSYTVTFNDWDGTELKQEDVDYGGIASAPADPTRPNYIFSGWDKEFDNIVASITITALYSPLVLKFSIYYMLYGGENSIDNPISYFNDAGVSSFKNATKTGYAFDGWFRDPGLNMQITEINVGDTGDTTLYVKWRINTYTVTFNDWDGSELKQEDVNYKSTATPPANPTRENYIFMGWDKEFENITAGLTITAQYSLVSGFNNLEELKLTVYPNPVVDNLTLTFKSNSSRFISVYGITGKLIETKESHAINESIDMSDYNSGLYIIKITEGTKEKQIKIHKK